MGRKKGKEGGGVSGHVDEEAFCFNSSPELETGTTFNVLSQYTSRLYH